ncbi:MAG TPA: hypothetical protein VGC22_09620 [Chitinophaga sp.]
MDKFPLCAPDGSGRAQPAGDHGYPAAGLLLAGHTIYDKTGKYKDRIEFGQVDTTASGILVHRHVGIALDPALQAKVNNCTVAKAPFPEKGPWIVLASDKKGRVYEADLHP